MSNPTYSIKPYSFFNEVSKKEQDGTLIVYTNGLEIIEEEYYGDVREGYEKVK